MIRLASPADISPIEVIVQRAYARYLPLMERPPRPLFDDYAARVTGRQAYVLEAAGSVAGLVVLVDRPDHLLLDNVAVDPDHQGRGLGRRLIAFAEDQARLRGYAEIRLYTNVVMHENQSLYSSLGYCETGRGEDEGYHVVFMAKHLD